MFVHHIGYYVTNLEESKKKFECLGYVVEQNVHSKKQMVR